MSRYAIHALIAIAFLALTACGGGGGGSGEAAAPPAPGGMDDEAAAEARAEAQRAAAEARVEAQRAALARGNGIRTEAPGTLALPVDHGLGTETVAIPAGEARDVGNFRLACADAEACLVAIDATAAQVRVTRGTVTLARLASAQPAPAPMQDPEPAQDPVAEIQWPAWAIMDIARAEALLGGRLSDWGSGQIRNEIHRRLANHHTGLTDRFGIDGNGNIIGVRHGSDGSKTARSGTTEILYDDDTGNIPQRAESGIAADTTEYDSFYAEHLGNFTYNDRCTWSDGIDECGNYQWQYQAVGRHKTGIPVVQARVGGERDWHDRMTIVGGLLDHADFWVVEVDDHIFDGGRIFKHGAFFRVLDVHGGAIPRPGPVSGTWNGALIGVGHNRAHQNLYRQHLVGDVSVAVNITGYFNDLVDIDVAFSNVKNANTGATVALSKTEWTINGTNSSWPSYTDLANQLRIPPSAASGNQASDINLIFGGAQGGGYSEVAGMFVLPETIGAFGAKKQP